MKKIILFLIIVLVSGCSLNGNKDFEAVCTKKEESNGFTNEKVITIYFNDTNNIKKLTENYKYSYTNEIGKSSFLGAKLALSSNINNNYIEEIVKDEENNYEVVYTLDVENLDDEELKKLNLRRNYYDQVREYKKNMICN